MLEFIENVGMWLGLAAEALGKALARIICEVVIEGGWTEVVPLL